MKKIVVLGAGYAGVLSAKHLEKKLKKNNDVEITIIDKNSYHTMLTELHEVAAGRVDEESIKMELSDIFAHRKVNVVLDEIQTVDFDKKSIKGVHDDYTYDYLVIASGSKPTFFGTPGHESAYQLWTYQDAVNLQEQILHCFRAAACTKDEKERRKLLTFSIVGSGFTGVEMAGELGEYKDELARKFNIDVNEITINIIDVVPHVLPLYPDHLVKKVEKKFEKLGVTPICGNAVAEIGEDYIKVGEQIIEGYTNIWAAGVEGSEFVDNNKTITQAGRGRFETNKYLQSVDKEDVYVVGDNIFYIPEGEDKPVPQMVENAEKSSSCAAHNIIAAINGGQLEEYKPKFNGSMVCVGGRWGVAYIGSKPEKMKSFSGFIAMFIKHLINFIYFIQVLGLHKWYSYAKHEFFTVKEKRSFLGGHFSNATAAPTIFLVPLRIFLGVMWLISGLAKLPGLLDNWKEVTTFPSQEAYATLINPIATSGDAGTSATGVQGAAGGCVTDAVASTGDAAGGFIQTLTNTFELSAANPLPRPGFIESFMEWIFNLMFWDGKNGFTVLAAIFQSGMIFAEIGVGLLFIAGLLTPLAAIASFAMMIMIYMSGWAYASILFFGFAGLACIFAGNSLGLDYYFLPWLDKKLRTWKFTKKWYLYFK